MKIDHTEILDNSFISICGRMALLIEEAKHRERTILHTSISSDSHRFYGTVIWQEKGQQASNLEIEEALGEIGSIALQGVPEKTGYIFYANEVRQVLRKLVQK